MPSDHADIVVYKDDACKQPYLVVENKAQELLPRERAQAIEQLFGNCNSLRAPVGLYDELGESSFFDVANYPQTSVSSIVKGIERPRQAVRRYPDLYLYRRGR